MSILFGALVNRITEISMKKRKDVGCPNPHIKTHICLTPKQIETILSSLKLASMVRSERERLYLKKIMKDIHEQGAL